MSKPNPNATDGTAIIADDPYLEPHAEALRRRYQNYLDTRRLIASDGDLDAITSGHHYFGLNRGECDGIPGAGVWYREWAPGADYLALIGDFNAWDRGADPLTRGAYGTWERFFPDEHYADRLLHDGRIKVHVANNGGYAMDRIPAYIRRVVQEEGSADYTGRYWCPPESYEWKTNSDAALTSRDRKGAGQTPGHSAQGSPLPDGRGSSRQAPSAQGLRIYEAHVGMAQEEGKVGSYDEFRENILPRIADLGYNAVQLMAVQEHPYYGSFGYHVSNLFAPSSRFGTPYELKQLIDAAHGLGLRVIMDIVHSHMVKNLHEGLNRFDGTGHQYFHAGPRGEHHAWDSKCFDYAKFEVLRLLLSNVRYWIDEFRFDGFRFDGITSMLYRDHGLGKAFTNYGDYFGNNVDDDAVTYLQLANEVAHGIETQGPRDRGAESSPPQTQDPRPDTRVITIAEDVSGMPGLALPIQQGGMGFDYRLAMGVPDYWIKLLKEKRDEEWNLGDLYATLMNRRFNEKHIGYAESHDQALVGDKTLAFRLMDASMYTDMSKMTPSLIIDRGIALHKMIRLVTFSLAGEGYLNFMGNEFGHPEWIDFPREGNHNSYHYARRQWSLIEQNHLRYHGLNDFDHAMQALDSEYGLLADKLIEQLAVHEDTRQLIYRRGPLVFAFNFHATESYESLRLPIPDRCDYRLILDTDAEPFSGQGRVKAGQVHPWEDVPMYNRKQSLRIYLPARSAQVLVPI